MLDFDKQINDYVTSKRGLYRRYCNDLIVIITIKHSEIISKKYNEYTNEINKIAKSIPGLDLNSSKTEQFIY